MSLAINHYMTSARISNTLNTAYGKLSESVQHLSSGLEIASAADKPAGFALSQLQRADIATLMQGARNANDAVSMIQTADGAMGVIDEKLIRMRELAEQAATGTYTSTQRLIIDSEFQQMASEIERIAMSTDFNGIKLLDGSLSGAHDGSQLSNSGTLKIHFGTGNDSAEDYFYLNIPPFTLAGLGLREPLETTGFGSTPIISDKVTPGVRQDFASGIISFAVIPAGTKDFQAIINDHGQNDTIQIFTRSGEHIAGTYLNNWTGLPVDPSSFMTEENGFLPDATYSNNRLNGFGGELTFQDEDTLHQININGMKIGYTGDGNTPPAYSWTERVSIDETTEDLIVIVAGGGVFDITANWSEMPDTLMEEGAGPVMSIATQENAQKASTRISDAIAFKDAVRGHLGAAQNRLENTFTDLNIKAENLMSSDSRRADIDVSTAMTEFSQLQILSQINVAMLAQANSLPQKALDILGR